MRRVNKIIFENASKIFNITMTHTHFVCAFSIAFPIQLTFRMMGFVGGIAMIISNGLAILDRFMGFNWTGALIALYECIFGIMSKSQRNFSELFVHQARCLQYCSLLSLRLLSYFCISSNFVYIYIALPCLSSTRFLTFLLVHN